MDSTANKKTGSQNDISGAASDAWPAFSYRRAGRSELARRKRIKCPYCTNYFYEVDRNKVVQTYRTPKNRRKDQMQGMEFIQCIICKNEVGVITK